MSTKTASNYFDTYGVRTSEDRPSSGIIRLVPKRSKSTQRSISKHCQLSIRVPESTLSPHDDALRTAVPDLFAAPITPVPADSLTWGSAYKKPSYFRATYRPTRSSSLPQDPVPPAQLSRTPSSSSKASYTTAYDDDEEFPERTPDTDIIGTPSVQAYPPIPAIPAHFKPERILSIDEIIKQNAASLVPPRYLQKAGSAPAAPTASSARKRARTMTDDGESGAERSSVDSITGEVLEYPRTEVSKNGRALHHVRSQPALMGRGHSNGRPESSASTASQSISSDTIPNGRDSRSSNLTGVEPPNDRLTQYIRSTRLTRLLTLRRPPNHQITISLADVGIADGHPVLVYLGLGCVRYLIALYDELAQALGLRLICIDRWGLGKTTDVPQYRRGFMEWTSVVEEVLDQMGIQKFSIIAHSAGAPYALASSVGLESRVSGSVHLLAPWVSLATEGAAGSYKWLKFVPSSVIKTAQAAEWKIQGWRLGKSQSASASPVVSDPRSPVSSADVSPVLASFGDNGEDPENPSTPRTATQEQWSRPSSRTSSGSPRPSFKRTSSLRGAIGYTRTRSGIGQSKGVASFSASDELLGTTEGQPQGEDHFLDLGPALLRASHAESMKGGMADLLTILERTNKPAGFSHSDVAVPVRVWHGTKDEKISLQSVLSLETSLPDCKVKIIPGADHSLMTNVEVFAEVLRSIADEAKSLH